MKKLVEIVTVEENNVEAILLGFKPNSRIDLIKLGFKGNEEMIYLSKGDNHTCRIHYTDGTSKSWHWGIGGYTLVSSTVEEWQRKIVDCVVDDMDIAIEGRNAIVRDSNKTGTEKANHTIKVLYWNDKSDDEVVVHKDNIFYKRFPNETSVISHFVKLGYNVKLEERGYSKYTGCNIDRYFCTAL